MNARQFKSLVLPAYAAMERTAVRILRDRSDAADAVQDVMRRLWEIHDEIDASVNMTAYAVRAVSNRCIDIVRMRKPMVEPGQIPDIADTDDDEDAELLEALNRAIALLDEPHHTILNMSLDGRRTVEIAHAVGLSESNVRQILFRTRKELKKRLTSLI